MDVERLRDGAPRRLVSSNGHQDACVLRAPIGCRQPQRVAGASATAFAWSLGDGDRSRSAGTPSPWIAPGQRRFGVASAADPIARSARRLPRLRWAVPMPAQQRSIRQDGPVADDLGRSAATREP